MVVARNHEVDRPSLMVTAPAESAKTKSLLAIKPTNRSSEKSEVNASIQKAAPPEVACRPPLATVASPLIKEMGADREK